MNQVRSKEKLVTTIYTMFGSAVAFTFAGATLIGGYVHDFVVHEAAKEVRANLRLDKAKGLSFSSFSFSFSVCSCIHVVQY